MAVTLEVLAVLYVLGRHGNGVTPEHLMETGMGRIEWQESHTPSYSWLGIRIYVTANRAQQSLS